MDFSSLKNKFLIIFCLFVFLFPFFCITGFCSDEEQVEYSVINNLGISENSNVFISGSSNANVGYIETDSDYIYYIYNNTTSGSFFNIAQSNDIPAVNVEYDYLYKLQPNETYTYKGNGEYLYLCFRASSDGSIPVVTRQKIESMNGAVSDLVSNVGINSIWNIFDISINYIVIVVLFAFGCFLIFTIIRKISKGKGDV